jgi:hypothetical protein
MIKSAATNERFVAMAALPRGQFCANLDVITPQQVQWKPPLRQAAGTLAAMQKTYNANKYKLKIEPKLRFREKFNYILL